MYTTRGALGLLWRAVTNFPDTARLWSDAEVACARELQKAGLCNIESRNTKEEEALHAIATERGRDSFLAILEAVEELVGGSSIGDIFPVRRELEQ